MTSALELWTKFKKHYLFIPERGFALDISRMDFSNTFFADMNERVQQAFSAMDELEAGGIANPDEKRMVGHYWLRDSKRAPSKEIRSAIDNTLSAITTFADKVHRGEISPAPDTRFAYLLVVGIGGSALGPQFVTQALGGRQDKLQIFFFDNTDPDGMQNVLSKIPDLKRALCVVISKSGGTKETRNGQLVAKAAFEAQGLQLSKHFIAVTGEGSELDQTAKKEKWLARFPMWDWVGGRTSEMSAVGLLPAALQGFDINAMLKGAAEMDELTRSRDVAKNPAALLALMWFHAGNGKGGKDMVILPYKDRLELFSRYLQQLVMESLGKERDLSGKVVNQGIAVYGNKGSTDQHAYVQQLREGLNNFFAVFIEVLKDRSPATALCGPDAYQYQVEPGVQCGDYLGGFYLGTRSALYENKRESVSIIIDEVNAYTVGLLIALFERAVGLYASLVNINAYHQPGVEAGKKAAARVLEIQAQVLALMDRERKAMSVEEIARALASPESTETIFKLLRRLLANGRVKEVAGKSLFENSYVRG